MSTNRHFLALALVVLLSACGNDDDSVTLAPVDSDDVAKNAVYTTNNGKQAVATQIGDLTFSYNSAGLPYNIDGGSLSFIYSSGTLLFDNNYGSAPFSMNSGGNITRLDYNEERRNGDSYLYTLSGVMKLSYTSGRLMSWGDTSTELEEDNVDFETFSQAVQRDCKLTWSDGSLTGATYTETGTKDGSDYTVTRTYYIDNDLTNQCSQATMAYRMLFDGRFADLSLVGVFGRASSLLPCRIVVDWTYTDKASGADDNGTDVYDITYTFKSTGLIDTETINTTDYSYTYSLL